MKINPLTAIDFYKADHRNQYPEGTTEVYSNFTPRSSRLAKLSSNNKVVMFGLQYFLKHFLIESWDKHFFQQDKIVVLEKYKKRMDSSLGKDAISVEHIEALHDLGYLPIKIKALPEGVSVPVGVPVLTVVNTHPDFFWLTNYIESVISCYLWKPMTSATLAFEYRHLLAKYAVLTGTPLDFVLFQAHDFSFRGLSSLQDSAVTGAGHLLSFWGTDTVPAIDMLEDYYAADLLYEPIGVSVPATEHSVMCMGQEHSELDTFKRLIDNVYPSGIVSIVSDTWDFWKVITEYLPTLKDTILNRQGKVVIRPDSGDPVKIICGDPDAPEGSVEYKGAIESLWEIFGGEITPAGYKILDEHIGLIYGDSITLDRATQILSQLKSKGFASGNIVLGVGSYTYQYVTRDNYGFAMKATSGVVNGERRDIFKNPKTDSGVKKSAKGLLRIELKDNQYVLYDQQTEEEEDGGELQTVFKDGRLIKEHSLAKIRERVTKELNSLLNEK